MSREREENQPCVGEPAQAIGNIIPLGKRVLVRREESEKREWKP